MYTLAFEALYGVYIRNLEVRIAPPVCGGKIEGQRKRAESIIRPVHRPAPNRVGYPLDTGRAIAGRGPDRCLDVG